jgi:hypothetical protein
VVEAVVVDFTLLDVLLDVVTCVVGFDVVGLDSVLATEVITVVWNVAAAVVGENGFGTSESTTPIGPSRSISDSGHVNSSGCIE